MSVSAHSAAKMAGNKRPRCDLNSCCTWGAPQSPDSCVSQLLQGSDVELHPDEGEEIEEELHSRVQAGRRSAGRHTGQKCPAQVCREYGLAESVLLRWRREYEVLSEAAFTEKQLSHAQKLWGAEDSRAGAILRILRQAGLGERDPKKGAGEIPLGRRCAMIGEAIVQHPEMSVLRLCELFGVSRSWYYEKPNFEEKARQEVELGDHLHVRLPTTFCYLATILDDFSR